MSNRSHDVAVGFTDAQRRFFHERDEYRCQFWYVQQGKWVRCKNTVIEVHHVVPRYWASVHYPKTYAINGMNQGVCICPTHHVGAGISTRNGIYVLHPDNITARLDYQNGDKQAYQKMFKAREDLTRRGIPYWCTTWDAMLLRVIQKANGRFARNHPYPTHRKYGNRGR